MAVWGGYRSEILTRCIRRRGSCEEGSESPISSSGADPANPPTREADWNEDLGRAYLFWTPHPWLALRAEYLFERFKRDEQLPQGLTELNSHRIPLGIRVFHPSGLSASLTATYFNQEGDFTGAVATRSSVWSR